jgi:hypothetical protein
VRADAARRDQPRDASGERRGGLVARGLDLGELAAHLLEAFQVAADLGREVAREGPPVAGGEPVEALGGARAQRLEVVDPPSAHRPLTRLTCRTRSATGAARSRVGRRASSASGVGTRTTAHTRRSPRARAIIARSSASASIRSVSARRARRSTAIEAGSITRFSTPLATRRRCSRKPSRPAS